jgi:hypothetical protein
MASLSTSTTTGDEETQRLANEALAELLHTKEIDATIEDGELARQFRAQIKGNYSTKPGTYEPDRSPNPFIGGSFISPSTPATRIQAIMDSIAGQPGDLSIARHINEEYGGIAPNGHKHKKTDGSLDQRPRNKKAREKFMPDDPHYSRKDLALCCSLRGTKWKLQSKKGISVLGVVVHVFGTEHMGQVYEKVLVRFTEELVQSGSNPSCDVSIKINEFLPDIFDKDSSEGSDVSTNFFLFSSICKVNNYKKKFLLTLFFNFSIFPGFCLFHCDKY